MFPIRRRPRNDFRPRDNRMTPQKRPRDNNGNTSGITLKSSRPFARLLRAMRTDMILTSVLGNNLRRQQRKQNNTINPHGLARRNGNRLTNDPTTKYVSLNDGTTRRLYNNKTNLTPNRRQRLYRPNGRLRHHLPNRLSTRRITLPFQNRNRQNTTRRRVTHHHTLKQRSRYTTHQKKQNVNRTNDTSTTKSRTSPRPLTNRNRKFFKLSVPRRTGNYNTYPVVGRCLAPRVGGVLFCVAGLSIVVVPAETYAIGIPWREGVLVRTVACNFS